MSRYEEAIEARLRALDFLRSTDGIEFILWLAKDMGMLQWDAHRRQYLDESGELDRMVMCLSTILKDADSYYWTPDVLDTLESAAKTLTDSTITVADVPSAVGFMYLPRPTVVAEMVVEAIGWIGYVDAMHEEGDSEIVNIAPSDLHGIVFVCFNRKVAGGPLAPISFAKHLFGVNGLQSGQTRGITGVEADLAYPDQVEDFSHKTSQLLVSSFFFLSQPAFKIEDTEMPRPARRRIGSRKDGAPVRPVKVVYLRRPRHKAETAGEVEWSKRWWVRVHWRHYYNADGTLRMRRLIQPYVKGPDDKPLEEPRPHVFAVVR